MATTEVKYLGLDLKSPVIVSSCSLTADVEKVKEMQHAGAGAVVMKSLFEEQIRGEVEFMASAGHSYPEMDDYLHAYIRSNSIAQYTEKVKALKQAVTIPVIASINCYSPGEWVEYARQVEAAGADALEINLYDPAVDPRTSPASIEEGYISVIRSIVSELRIPVAVKIGQHYTSIVNFADRLASCGAKGVVIFNRFFRPDIDIENFRLVPAAPLSHEGEYGETLRWTAILSSVVKTDIAVTTGIHTPETRRGCDCRLQRQDSEIPGGQQCRKPFPDPWPSGLFHHSRSGLVRARPVHEDFRFPSTLVVSNSA